MNGAQVGDTGVQHGAWIQAGHTIFSVHVEARTPPPRRHSWDDFDGEELDEVERLRLERMRAEEAERTSDARAALAVLHDVWAKAPLHAILDAARDRRVVTLLHESVDECASLYEGTQGESLEDAAPYLVRFADRSALLERLVMEGWGRRWGIFFTSEEPFKEARRHFRRFLIVELEKTSEAVYFRFYDPTVLRAFISASPPRQRQQFMAGREFLVEHSTGRSGPHAGTIQRFAMARST